MLCQAALLYLAVHHPFVSAMEDLHHHLGLQARCAVNHSILLSSGSNQANKAAVQLVHPTAEQHIQPLPSLP